MKTTILAIILILISCGAFFMTGRAMYQLRQMDLLTKTYWKENGLKTVLLTIIWLLLLVGGVGLLLVHLFCLWRHKQTLFLIFSYFCFKIET